MASIKNFQIIPKNDSKNKDTVGEFLLQFGKIGSDLFIIDMQFPFSVYQGFGLVLSAFETD